MNTTRILAIFRTEGVKMLRISRLGWRELRRQLHSVSVDFGGGSLVLETGSLARFADGAVQARLGDTAVLVTAVSRARSKPLDFLPLTVDFRLKAAAAGRIPTNFLRRELGPSDIEILTSRMIDRSLRPLFPKGYSADTQLTANVVALDGVHEADVLALNAASAALAVSDIPFPNPVAAVRLALLGEKDITINPNRKQMANSRLNVVMAAVGDSEPTSAVVMLDGEADEVPRQLFFEAVQQGLQTTRQIIHGIASLASTAGKTKREWEASDDPPSELLEKLRELAEQRLVAVFSDPTHDKISRDQAVQEIRVSSVEALAEAEPENPYIAQLSGAFSELTRQVFRETALSTARRCDGRDFDQIRPTSCSVGLHGPLHGSALFQRGQTQVLTSVTFDSPDAAFRGDAVSRSLGLSQQAKAFMLHYEFPPYATNEIATGNKSRRRELGHGALAEKGLRAIVPPDHPFTIRLSAEVLESNGSSSMASICGGSLALLHAGVPIKRPAAGVAMGLFSSTDDPDASAVLTDISGIEDYFGDMDFKIGGTRNGLTALQLDLKIPGLAPALFNQALEKASLAHATFLDIMGEVISSPRDTSDSETMPVTSALSVPAGRVAQVLGVGGANLKRLTAETGVQVSSVGDGSFQLFAPNAAAMEEAQERLASLMEDSEPELEFGAIYTGTIVELRESGVMLRIGGSRARPHFIHNSQLDSRKVAHPSALGLSKGSELSVKCFGREPVSGRLRLSRKALLSIAPPSISRAPAPTSSADAKANPANPWASMPKRD